MLIWEEDDSDVCSVTSKQQIPAEEEAIIVWFMCVWQNGYTIQEYTCMASSESVEYFISWWRWHDKMCGETFFVKFVFVRAHVNWVLVYNNRSRLASAHRSCKIIKQMDVSVILSVGYIVTPVDGDKSHLNHLFNATFRKWLSWFSESLNQSLSRFVQ